MNNYIEFDVNISKGIDFICKGFRRQLKDDCFQILKNIYIKFDVDIINYI